MKAIGIDVHDNSGDHARAGRVVTGFESSTFRANRRVAPSVDALQHQDQKEGHDEAVGRLTSWGSVMTMPSKRGGGRAS